ncbi:hypothetical protein ASPWEDRAFT_184302 [Aspergillus wentii DTO 134E9]|uniref:Mid2 domain-containing protein n=1 Tax=Aspergillus wentii DTO 134E9 TaxID=1073089 RepID=A0A1L9RFQ0_ASPWE|nr:uncharacterized protein ASPWEDRAFT_184302 [Aspergillus wentii DTO 134E9]OJJ33734.1 hypothetical protein ASPWEDRAFT_184302 [Aspergillus wentii DTO 134E9]
MSGSQFDPTRYYHLTNTVNNTRLALGGRLFYDHGVYFIRNLDYEARYQLGLNTSDQSIPSMMETGSALGMQWNITQADSGIWELRNLLVGQANVLALSENAKRQKVPVMNTNPTEGKWTMDINPSENVHTTDSMMSPFPSIESPTDSASTSPSSLSGGAIAGIVVGCVAAALIILAALFFFFRRSRRRQAAPATKSRDAPANDQSTSQKLPELESNLTVRAELDATRQTSELPAYRHG